MNLTVEFLKDGLWVLFLTSCLVIPMVSILILLGFRPVWAV